MIEDDDPPFEESTFDYLDWSETIRLPNSERKKYRIERDEYKARRRARQLEEYREKYREVDELRAGTLLSHYVGQTVALEPARWANGQLIPHEQQGRCPAPNHPNDEQKSFYVSDRKGFYHCFGCCIHGDIIRWHTDFMGLSYADAMAAIRKEAAMMLQETEPARRLAAQSLAKHGKPVTIHDSWTLDAGPKTSNGMNFATRPYSPADNYPGHPLLTDPKLTLNRLPGLLAYNMKIVCANPQVRTAQKFDCWGSEQLHGSIILGAFGSRMLMATLRNSGKLPSAVTVQLRGHEKHGLTSGHIDARLVAFIGAKQDLRRDLSDLYRFLRHPKWIDAALADSKTLRNALEPFEYAGMPHSDEARLYAALWNLQTPGLERSQSYARPLLKPRL